ncbi:insulinase family protein [Deinococcus radiophilus]|uniref:insulinase family protein n=1 Tax=Deinococcus radiophilus TaxID=32062 RepID=UPI001E38D0C7|nr:insulinase family protein [Deinococcus radiophilus]UFA49475.1 insulinase family protein [Deinococcus radiophilus]
MTLTLPKLPQPGQRLGRYLTEEVHDLPEMQGTLVLLRHENGARHAHVQREDDNLAFGVTFPTVPQDSSGVAHILEHNVLMGSQRYPVADPFFTMIPRSLSTFMNAMTAADWTTYPFSTRNRTDFFNLLSVYLDATFFPLLRRESFLQDGWRLEHEVAGDPSSPLRLGGVVYNEMKGAMATPGSVLFRAFGKALYPDLTYANNSGGQPSAIPTLTYEGMKAFHAAHYHPSNAYFYSYGTLPLEEVLDAIEEQVMSRFEAQTLDVSIPDQPPFNAPRREEVFYAGSDLERGSQVAVGWKLGPVSDPRENLRWSVLSDILLGNPAAPLMQPLIDSDLGTSLADVSGYRDSYREGAFAAGLKGLPLGQTEAVEALVLETLRQIAEEGIDPELIESSLHGFELSSREVSNAGFPYGLGVMFGMVGSWMYGGNPAGALRLEPELTRLRADLKAGPVFEPMLCELLGNPHRVTLTLTPDPELTARTEAEEREQVAGMAAALDDAGRARILADSAALETWQAQEPDESVLPSLGLDDVTRHLPRPDYGEEHLGSVTLGRIPQPTGSLTYLDVQTRLPELTQAQIQALPLYAAFVTKSGAAERDYLALARRIEAVTGGIGASVGVGHAPGSLDNVRLSLTVSGKALARNDEHLRDLLRDLLEEPQFTDARMRQLLGQRYAALKSSVVSAGNAYAERLAAAQVSRAGALQESMSGLTSLERIKALTTPDADLTKLLGTFGEITALLPRGETLLALTATPQDVGLDLNSLAQVFAQEGHTAQPDTLLLGHQPQARVTDSPVNFNAVAWQTVPFAHPDSPALLVLTRLLRSEYLLGEIREKGGAYGAGASLDSRAGVFTLSSYRDPQLGRTFEVFAGIPEFLASGKLKANHLTEAILGSSKTLDPLTSPDTVGRMRFFGDHAGFSTEVKEDYLARLLTVTLEDVNRVAGAYLTPDKAAYATVTGKDPAQDGGFDWVVKEI